MPLAAVFTEKNPETSEFERFVYIQTPNGYEKRPVKVGISDYFFAEIQAGLSPGDVVSLEMPKEEREKQAKEVASNRTPGGPAGPAGKAPGKTSATNSPAVQPKTLPTPVATPAAVAPTSTSSQTKS